MFLGLERIKIQEFKYKFFYYWISYTFIRKYSYLKKNWNNKKSYISNGYKEIIVFTYLVAMMARQTI